MTGHAAEERKKECLDQATPGTLSAFNRPPGKDPLAMEKAGPGNGSEKPFPFLIPPKQLGDLWNSIILHLQFPFHKTRLKNLTPIGLLASNEIIYMGVYWKHGKVLQFLGMEREERGPVQKVMPHAAAGGSSLYCPLFFPDEETEVQLGLKLVKAM